MENKLLLPVEYEEINDQIPQPKPKQSKKEEVVYKSHE